MAMAREAAPSPGAALSGNLAPAMAVGAAAAPGAFGAVRVTAAQTADPPMPTKRQNPMAQVDGTIRWLVKNQDQGAELQLHPESLGRVQIKLKVEGNVVHAKLWASEASAIPVMQEHRAFLEDSLKSQGLVLGSFDLQHGRRDDQAPTPSSQPSASAISGLSERPRTGQETPAVPAAAAPRGNRIEYVA
jgi:flagellar hook-length control protein FliK